MKTSNFPSSSASPEIADYLAQVEINRRPTGGIDPTPDLIAAMTRANASAGCRLDFSGQPKPPIRRERVH